MAEVMSASFECGGTEGSVAAALDSARMSRREVRSFATEVFRVGNEPVTRREIRSFAKGMSAVTGVRVSGIVGGPMVSEPARGAVATDGAGAGARNRLTGARSVVAENRVGTKAGFAVGVELTLVVAGAVDR